MTSRADASNTTLQYDHVSLVPILSEGTCPPVTALPT